ncbi:hypothetical protein MHYP_G00241600 [Metynnis hypsauchen]
MDENRKRMRRLPDDKLCYRKLRETHAAPPLRVRLHNGRSRDTPPKTAGAQGAAPAELASAVHINQTGSRGQARGSLLASLPFHRIFGWSSPLTVRCPAHSASGGPRLCT